MSVRAWVTGKIFYPLWDLKDGSPRMRELRNLERSQWLPPEELRRRQREAATRIVAHAARRVPFYQETLARVGLPSTGEIPPEAWRRIPLLTKHEIRENEDRLISEGLEKEKLVRARTGGSTGTALRVYFDTDCQERRNAAAIRSDRWAGWEPGMRRISVWGNPHLPHTMKAWIRNALHDRMEYLDTMAINEGSLRRFLGVARNPEPFLLQGHAHSIFIVARWLEARGERVRPAGIITTSMMLLGPEREVIERAFQCRVTDRYGCEEVGLIACECERHHGMHLNEEHLLVECLRDNGEPAAPGEEGKLVLTDLLNRAMPLIRYRIEDVGIVSDRPCPCGRGLPILERVVGRTADFLVRSDGSLVAGVSLVERTLTALPGIEQMQIVQESVDSFRLRLVTAPGYTRETEDALKQELRGVFGEEVRIEVECVDRIQQDPSGKYRFSICQVAY